MIFRKKGYILILGSKIDRGGYPKRLLQERLDAGIYLGQKLEEYRFVLTGRKEEVEAMEAYLLAEGIEGGRIIVEDNSYSSYDNLYNSYHLLEKIDGDIRCKDLIVITNDFHILRIGRIGYKLAIPNLYLYGCRTPLSRIGKLKVYLREGLAHIKGILTGK